MACLYECCNELSFSTQCETFSSLEVFDFPGVTLLYIQYLLKYIYIYKHNTRALTHKTHARTFSLFPLVLPSSHFSLSASKALLTTVFVFISVWPLSLSHFHLPFNNLFKFSVSHYQVLPFLFAPSQFRSLPFVHFSVSASISICFKRLILRHIWIAFPLLQPTYISLLVANLLSSPLLPSNFSQFLQFFHISL